MTAAHLDDLLTRALRGECPLDQLLAALDAAAVREPAVAHEFMQTVEARYARNEVRYDVFLVLKDRFMALGSASRTAARSTHVAPAAEPARVVDSDAHDGATRVRRAPASPAIGAAPATDGATQLRGASAAAAARTDDATQLRREPVSTAAGADEGTQLRREPAHHAAGTVHGATSPTGGATAFDEGAWTLTNEQPLEPGSLIKGRFLLEERVGAGGMGVVFKARDLRKEEAQDRDPYVAIKFLNPEFRRHPESLKTLQRETRRAQSLAHPNVVTVYDFDRDGTLIYMTMEYLAGEPLDRFIQRHPQGLNFNVAWPIIEGAGRALMYAHEEGVVHSDFKPGNVFVVDKKCKVLDFGIARAMKTSSEPTDPGQFDPGSLGALTPAYASPEMLLDQASDPRDDVYALACVAHELMTGRHPFNGVPALQAMHDGLKVKKAPGMGRYQYKALQHALAFRQADRTPSVEAFLDEIAGPFGRRGRAIRQVVVSNASTAVVIGLIGAALWWYTRPDPDEQLERRLVETATAQFEADRAGGADAQTLDPELVQVLLEQGTDYLASGRKEFDPSVLSEGVSSALGAFQEVLRMDPKNADALRGIVDIVHVYEAEMQHAADAGNDQRVVELAGYARRIDPNRPSLESMEIEARKRLEAPEPRTE